MLPTILIASLIFAAMAAFIVYFVYTYQKKQIENLRREAEMRSAFQEELNAVQEEALAHLSMELHDNVGQTLAVARLYAGDLADGDAEDSKTHKVLDSVTRAIADMRALALSYNSDALRAMGLEEALRTEAARLSDAGHVAVSFHAHGFSSRTDPDKELMLFRMSQELLSNALRHSGAKNIALFVLWEEKQLRIRIADDGNGFDAAKAAKGQGLNNLQKRAGFIGASVTVDSEPGKGTVGEIRVEL